MYRKLLIFSIWHGPNPNDLSADSNSWFFKNYEQYFEEIQQLTLAGPRKEAVLNGKSGYYFRGSNRNLIDVVLSPIRLYKFVKQQKPSHIVTYEQVWLWWTFLLVKLFLRHRVYLIPMTFPEQMYRVTGKAISGKLPIWLERIFLKWSYRICYKVVTSYNLGNYIHWMKENKIIQKKLIIVNSLPESIVFPAFMQRLQELEAAGIKREGKAGLRLIYVGRLHKEKMTDHLINAMALIKAKVPDVSLLIVGQGPDKEVLQNMAKELNVHEAIEFRNYVPHSVLPDLLTQSDIFVAPSTGHAFREAAICALPIVSYNIDWIKGFLTHGENFYGIDNIDYKEFADGVIKLCQDNQLRSSIKKNIHEFALQYWSKDKLGESIRSIFSESTEDDGKSK